MDPAEIDHRFRFHPASTEGRRLMHEAVRGALGNVARNLDVWVPDGREKATALTKLEEAMMWANAGIARQGPAGPAPLVDVLTEVEGAALGGVPLAGGAE